MHTINAEVGFTFNVEGVEYKAVKLRSYDNECEGCVAECGVDLCMGSMPHCVPNNVIFVKVAEDNV